jgi:hypothetical protein
MKREWPSSTIKKIGKRQIKLKKAISWKLRFSGRAFIYKGNSKFKYFKVQKDYNNEAQPKYLIFRNSNIFD